jgi:hypothetical protein
MSGRLRRLAGAVLVSALALLAPMGVARAGTPGASSLSALALPAVGPGYVVLSQGPVDPSTFASSAPDPSAVSSALTNLGGTVSSYQRTWTDTGRLNAVQDMLFHFPNTGSAQIFLQSAQHSLRSGKIVTSGALPGVPGAQRVTYFGATDEAGVGQAVTLRVGDTVDLLSFFSASAGNAAPITQADATEVAAAQSRALHAATAAGLVATTSGSRSSSWVLPVGLAVLALVVVLAIVTLVRRRRSHGGLPESPAS